MDLLVTLVIAIAIIWLVQTFLGVLEVAAPWNKIVMVATVLLVLLWLFTGKTFFPR